MSSTQYSVFIPRVFCNISEHRIAHVFHNIGIGSVAKVDLVKKSPVNGKPYNMAFVHFQELYQTQEAQTFMEDIHDVSKQAKILYDDPWFWLVLPFEKKEKSSLDANANANANANALSNNTYQVSNPHLSQPIEANCYDNHYYQFQEQMVPMCMMTPQGPYWYWGIPQQQQYIPTTHHTKLVPPQVMYGKNYHKQRRHPRKRINAPVKTNNKKEEEMIQEELKTSENVSSKEEDGEL